MKKNCQRRLIYLLSTVMLLIVCCGCGLLEGEATREERRKAEALEYLEERYGEEFEILTYRGMSYAYDYVKMTAHPKTDPDKKHEFIIQGKKGKWGKLEYVDTYAMVKLTEDYEKHLDEVICKYYKEYKFFVKFRSEWLPDNLPATIKFEDLENLKANEDYPLPDIRLFIAPGENREFEYLEEFVRELSEQGFKCHGNMAYYEEQDIYDGLIDEWNPNVETLEDEEDVRGFLIYGKDNYEMFE